MRHRDFVEVVWARGDFESEAAARDAAEATMRTLGERIAAGEAKTIGEQLPDGLSGPLMTAGGDAESFPPTEFVDRVGRREDGADDPERHVRAVFEALRFRLDGGEWPDLRTQLPPEYGALFETPDEQTDA